jgi:hypothetical protein
MRQYRTACDHFLISHQFISLCKNRPCLDGGVHLQLLNIRHMSEVWIT